jgi:hypothetical protein
VSEVRRAATEADRFSRIRGILWAISRLEGSQHRFSVRAILRKQDADQTPEKTKPQRPSTTSAAVSPHFSRTGYGADNAYVAELARAPTNPYNALNSGEFSYSGEKCGLEAPVGPAHCLTDDSSPNGRPRSTPRRMASCSASGCRAFTSAAQAGKGMKRLPCWTRAAPRYRRSRAVSCNALTLLSLWAWRNRQAMAFAEGVEQ